MGLECRIAQSPAARKTKAQLQKELEEARTGQASQQVENEIVAQRSPLSQTSTDAHGQLPSLDSLPRGGTEVAAVRASPTLDSLPSSQLPINTPGHIATAPASCSPQILGGQEVSSSAIADCFSRSDPCAPFFLECLLTWIRFSTIYATSFLPTLGSSLGPDDHHQRCPFFFWATVYVGSRYYTKDPTLVGQLAPRLNDMAFQALQSRSYPILTIQGILLLIMWPVPMDTLQRDLSIVLAGAALHLARQIGLHIPGSGHDFARSNVGTERPESAIRTLLWELCCEVYCGYAFSRYNYGHMTKYF